MGIGIPGTGGAGGTGTANTACGMNIGTTGRLRTVLLIRMGLSAPAGTYGFIFV